MRGGGVALWVVAVCAVACGACAEEPAQCMIERRGLERRVVRVAGDCRGRSFEGVDLSGADVTAVLWGDNVCPDGSRSQDNPGGTCLEHLRPREGGDDLREEEVEPPPEDMEEDDGGADPPDQPEDVVEDEVEDELEDCSRNECGGCGPLTLPLGRACDPCVEVRALCGEDGQSSCAPSPRCLAACVDAAECAGGDCSNGRCVPAGLVWVPPGEVQVALHGGEAFGAEVVQPARITVGLLVMPHEVTQLEWVTWIGNEPWAARDCPLQCPVERVTWFEALVYANVRSLVDGLAPCYYAPDGVTAYEIGDALLQESVRWPLGVQCEGWRLPTEAEWEHLARAGSERAWGCGDDEGCLAEVARYDLTLEEGPQAVGALLPNAWGLYDTLGNVSEWCWDWYEALTETPKTDPVGPAGGALRVFRGGSFYNDAEELRPGFRNASAPGLRDDGRGFRLVRSVRAP
jgi:sulfatase modifying factor 1